jgi:hypothetical protein
VDRGLELGGRAVDAAAQGLVGEQSEEPLDCHDAEVGVK